MLKKFLGNPTSILPVEGLGVDENISYEEVLVEILDCQVKRLRNKEVATVKGGMEEPPCSGSNMGGRAYMRSCYPHLFSS